MNGIPVSFRLQKEAVACPQCGSGWRVREGLCLSCLLSQGLGTDSYDGESLEDVLGESAIIKFWKKSGGAEWASFIKCGNGVRAGSWR